MPEPQNVIFRLQTQVVDKDDPKELAATIERTDKKTKEAQASVDGFNRKLETLARIARQASEAEKAAGANAKVLGEGMGAATVKAATLGTTITKAGQALGQFTRVKPPENLLSPLIGQTHKLGDEANRTATAFERMKAAGTPGRLPANPTFTPSIANNPAILSGSAPGQSLPVSGVPRPAAPTIIPPNTVGLLEQLKGKIDEVNKRRLTITDPKQLAAANKELDTLNKQYTKLSASGTAAAKSNLSFGNTLKQAGSQITAFLGIGALVTGFFAIFRKGISDVVEFDDALAELSSITGAVGEDLDFLKEQAREVGRTSTVSAVDAVKAFTRIGSARPDLLKNKEALAAVTKEAIALAEAAKIDLADAGGAVAAAMNQFNLPASDASRIINVLAAGSKEGAAEVTDLTDSINKSGTVMAQNNVTFEQATALIETLAEKEIKGAVAGTQLRGVILKLVQSGKGFVDGQFNINAALTETKKEFDSIADPVKKAEKAVKLFGLENVTAGNILLENAGRVRQLTDAVTGTGVAYEQQAKNTATVSAAVARLRNALSDLFLGLSNSTGGFSKAILFIANNLKTFVKLGATALAVWGSYRLTIVAVNVAQRAWALATQLATAAQTLFTGATAGATTGVRAFTTAIRANPLGLLVSALTAVISYLVFFQDETEEATEAQKKFNEQIEQSNRLMEQNKSIAGRVKVLGALDTDQAEQLQQDVDAQIAEYNRLFTEASAAEKEFSGDIAREREARGKEVNRIEAEQRETADAATRFDNTLMMDYLESTAKDRVDITSITGKLITAAEAEEELKRLKNYKLSIDERLKQLGRLRGGGAGDPDAAMTGTIKALQDQQKKLLEKLTDKLRIGSPEFFKIRDEYLKVSEELKKARDLINETEVFPAGSLDDLNQELAFLRAQLNRLPEDSTQFEFVKTAVIDLEKDIERLQEKMKPKRDEDATKVLLARMEEENRHAIAVHELDVKAQLERARVAKATQAELAKIEADGDAQRLKLQLDFELRKLAVMRAGGKATADELKAQQNVIRELQLQLSLPQGTGENDGLKEFVQKVANVGEQIAQVGIQAWRAWSDAQERALDLQLQQQATRVEEARNLADKGNAAVLEAEKKRLQELTNARRKAAQQTAAIAQVEAAANAAVAITRAAAEGGGFLTAVTVASTLIALTAGLIQARSLATNSIPAFYHGGESDGGGYTGDGNPRAVSRAIGPKPYIYHRREYIMPHEVVGVGRNREWMHRIHRGRLDIDQLLHRRTREVVQTPSPVDTDRIVGAIERIPSTDIRFDGDGITGMVRGRLHRASLLSRRK